MNRSDVCICSLVSTEYLLLLRYSNTLILLTAIHFYAIIHPLSWEKTHLNIDATLNPDFGQVEVDPAVINLSASESYFEEKDHFSLKVRTISCLESGV